MRLFRLRAQGVVRTSLNRNAEAFRNGTARREEGMATEAYRYQRLRYHRTGSRFHLAHEQAFTGLPSVRRQLSGFSLDGPPSVTATLLPRRVSAVTQPSWGLAVLLSPARPGYASSSRIHQQR